MKIPVPRKLESGTWFIQLRLDGKSYSITDKDKRKCVAKAMAIKSGLAERKNPDKITLSQAIDVYIENRQNTLSPSTIRGYREIQRNRFKSAMHLQLNSIGNWQQICNAEARICSPKTLKNAWGLIASVLKQNNVNVPQIALPQQVKNERTWLTPEQIKVFVESIKDNDCEIAALLELHGLRRSEMLALSWSKNIDLKNKTIIVSGAIVSTEDNEIVLKKTNKTVDSTRRVPIMIERLFELLDNEEHKDGFVVKNRSARSLYGKINRICEKNNLPKVGHHGLRHSFASLAYHVGISEMALMQLGGWSDYQTVRKIYTHLSQTDLHNQANAMSDFFKTF